MKDLQIIEKVERKATLRSYARSEDSRRTPDVKSESLVSVSSQSQVRQFSMHKLNVISYKERDKRREEREKRLRDKELELQIAEVLKEQEAVRAIENEKRRLERDQEEKMLTIQKEQHRKWQQEQRKIQLHIRKEERQRKLLESQLAQQERQRELEELSSTGEAVRRRTRVDVNYAELEKKPLPSAKSRNHNSKGRKARSHSRCNRNGAVTSTRSIVPQTADSEFAQMEAGYNAEEEEDGPWYFSCSCGVKG